MENFERLEFLVLVDFPKIVFHKNLLLTITNITKKELSKSVQSFTRDAGTKENRDLFLYIFITWDHSFCELFVPSTQ